MMRTTSGGVRAAPKREAAWGKPWEKPRSSGGIQRDRERVAIGKAPASPTPKRNRHMPSVAALKQSAVNEVKSDHQHTMQARARRGPTLSPNQPPGIWKRAYPQRNELKIHPTATAERPRSRWITGMAEEMLTRSM